MLSSYYIYYTAIDIIETSCIRVYIHTYNYIMGFTKENESW